MINTKITTNNTPFEIAEPDIEWSAADLEEHLQATIASLQAYEHSGDTRFSTHLQILSLQKEEAWLHKKIAEALAWEAQPKRA